MTIPVERYAGLTVAPIAWGVSTQLGQILPYPDCNGHMWWSFGAVIATGIIALAGTLISYVGPRRSGGPVSVFVGHLSAGVGLAATFALLLQGAATLLLNPCQH